MFSFQRSVIFLLFVCFFCIIASAQTRSGKFGIGVAADGTELLGLSPSSNANISYGAGLSAFYSITEGVGLRSTLGLGQLGWKSPVTSQSVTTSLMYENFYVSADLMPNRTFNPFVMAGAGIVLFDPTALDGTRAPDKKNISSVDIHYIVGGGCDYFLNEFWSVTVKGEYVMTNSSWYDGGPTGLSQGKSANFIRAGLEVRYYFFDQSFITKMLEAIKDRFKKK
jgi:hypothetical protein